MFSLAQSHRNADFQTVSDFNGVNAFPVIPVEDGRFLCFQTYSIFEALYDSPLYWMIGDKGYRAWATTNRGNFAEEYAALRLRSIFGPRRVFSNVLLRRGKDTVGEIDVLVLFGNRAIIVQAKSKRLTIEARKGNDDQLRDDFKFGIKAAYEQGVSCARLLTDRAIELTESQGKPLRLAQTPEEIHIFCVLSDHYPALAFQARQFLELERDEAIMPPFVMDVFTLDVMAEMLSTPLYFLSYVNRRVDYSDKLMASHELTILSYHLKQNLWIDSEYDMVQLHDDVSVDLDVAMLARREGLPGKSTPDGILTRFANSSVGKLIQQIEHREDPASLDLGFLLLTLNEETIDQLGAGLDEITYRSGRDGKHHDITIGINAAESGLTVHCNLDSDEQAMRRLSRHCERRKYAQRSSTWHGICIIPSRGNIRFGCKLAYPWEQSGELDRAVADLPKGNKKLNLKTVQRPRRRKIGRNAPCPCGSGQKYKKCCLGRP